MRNSLLLLAFLIIISPSVGQEKTEEEPFTLEIDYDTPLTIDLNEAEEQDERTPKKKKPKKNVYYGLKTKKGYNKIVRGDEVIIEFFTYLKEYKQPDFYVRDIYWYDFKNRKISTSRKFDKRNGVILHGPFKRMMGDQVLEEGHFFVGTKHGRWIELTKNDILVDKEKYYKGWPLESKVAYYNNDRAKLKEVIPVEYGEREGFYYYFHPNGQVAVTGEYKFDSKVGIWNEYYDVKRRRKRQVRYPDDPFDKNFRPYILKEWNQYGKVIYDRSKDFAMDTSR